MNMMRHANFHGVARSAEKTEITIKSLLEWAFATECASFDFDEVGEVSGGHMPSYGAEYRIFQQLSLGKSKGEGVRPDTSFGRSYCHDDADLVASVLRNNVEFSLATRVASYARNCTVPKWDLGPQRLQPIAWGKQNQHGALGKTEVVNTVNYVVRGRKRQRKEHWVPLHWVPSSSQIACARREYLDWWGALLSVLYGLTGTEFSKFVLVDRMPPMSPWKKVIDTN